MNNFETHLRSMIELALSDQSFDDIEKARIYSIGTANKISKEHIDKMILEAAAAKEDSQLEFGALTFEEKFEYLYNIIQLMKIDSKVFLAEIRYCEMLAEKLGFDKKVVKSLSTGIFSDPSITSNREELMKAAQKYVR